MTTTYQEVLDPVTGNPSGFVLKFPDNVSIPPDPGNSDYQAYLASVTPAAPEATPQAPASTSDDAATSAAYEDLTGTAAG